MSSVEVERPSAPAASVGRRRRVIRAPRDFAAGLVLVAVAGLALAASAGLPAGHLRSMGPGMLPRSVAVLLGIVGFGIVVASLLKAGEGLGRWPLRGPLFVFLGVAAFAVTIRLVGLALAGPLVVLVSGAASPEARPRELAIFAVVLTAFCVGLFRFALQLPIPILILPGILTL